jgi:hypothetical protein
MWAAGMAATDATRSLDTFTFCARFIGRAAELDTVRAFERTPQERCAARAWGLSPASLVPGGRYNSDALTQKDVRSRSQGSSGGFTTQIGPLKSMWGNWTHSVSVVQGILVNQLAHTETPLVVWRHLLEPGHPPSPC